ncbi:MAG TPA: hypothetical protein VNX68_07685 [Nitrosopumilaceae archaeon]|jgi:hypothetical protein|nr:hypothetical protein [Nitrosopumilaceae archaeon]
MQIDNELFGDINELLSSADTKTVETVIVEAVIEEEHILIPLDYKVYSTNSSTGRKEIVDTLKCDRSKGIIPIGKARQKADLMKKVFKTTTFFVLETSSKIFTSGKVVTVENVVYQTK